MWDGHSDIQYLRNEKGALHNWPYLGQEQWLNWCGMDKLFLAKMPHNGLLVQNQFSWQAWHSRIYQSFHALWTYSGINEVFVFLVSAEVFNDRISFTNVYKSSKFSKWWKSFTIENANILLLNNFLRIMGVWFFFFAETPSSCSASLSGSWGASPQELWNTL